MTVYNPEIWLESAVRCLKEYTEAGVDAAIKDNLGHSAGLEVYEVVMEFPSDEMIIDYLPGKKSIIHFELDDVQDKILSFGQNVAKSVYDDSVSPHVIHEQEGRQHTLNFDVGIWAWDKSGGTTARLRARQILANLFSGSQAITSLMEGSDGGDGKLEILSYTGGHFTNEAVNDIRVFRMINTMFSVRVFSRTPNPITTITVEDFGYDLGLVLDPNLSID